MNLASGTAQFWDLDDASRSISYSPFLGCAFLCIGFIPKQTPLCGGKWSSGRSICPSSFCFYIRHFILLDLYTVRILILFSIFTNLAFQTIYCVDCFLFCCFVLFFNFDNQAFNSKIFNEQSILLHFSGDHCPAHLLLTLFSQGSCIR